MTTATRPLRNHRAALRKLYAPGTRIRFIAPLKARYADLTSKVLVEKGTEGVIVWRGSDKTRRFAGSPIPRVGVKVDGEKDARFFAPGGKIARLDGLSLDDIKAGRTAPARVFEVLALTDSNTFGDLRRDEAEVARLRKLAADYPDDGMVIIEREPGTVDLVRERESAFNQAKRIAKINAKRGPRGEGVIFVGLDGKVARVQ